MQCGKLVVGQCPEAMRDRYFLYPVLDSERPHLGYNLGQLITKKKSEGKFRLSYFKHSRTVNQTGRQHLSLVFTASSSPLRGKGNKYANNVTWQHYGATLQKKTFRRAACEDMCDCKYDGHILKIILFAYVQSISATKQQEYLIYLIIKCY